MTEPDRYILMALPMMLFLAGCALLLCWMMLRRQVFLIWIAFGYLPTSVALLSQSMMTNAQLSTWSPLTAVLYLTGATCFAHGVGLRIGSKAQPRAVLAIAVTTIVLLLVFSRIHESLAARMVVLNIGLGLIYVLKLPSIRRSWNHMGRWERLIGLSYTFSACYSMVRGVFVAATIGIISYEGLTQSLQWTLLLVGSLFFSLWLAFIVIVSAVNDVIEHLREERDTDPLSGLMNRRSFLRRVSSLHGAGLRQGEWFVLSCDIDHFKQVNDTLGHAAGDRVITHVANLLQSTAGPQDLVARFGGEEFILVMRRDDLNQACADAESLRRSIEAAQIPGVSRKITASFGLCRLDRSRSIAEVLVLVDLLLYEAKAAGRNCLSVDLRPAGASREILPGPGERVVAFGKGAAQAASPLMGRRLSRPGETFISV